MPKLNTLTAEDIKYHFVAKIEEVCKEHNIPPYSMAFHSGTTNLDAYYEMLDADNIDITLRELVALAHAAHLSMEIGLK